MLRLASGLKRGVVKTRADILSEKEVKALSKALKNNKNEDYFYIWRIGITTGLRVSDILNLRAETITTQKPYIKEIKTGKHRRIYIQKEIFEYISRKRKSLKPKEKVFSMTRQAVWKTFKRTAKDIGITKNIGTHTMRRTFSKKYMQKNGIYKLKKVLNHECLSDTVFYTISNAEFQGESTTKERS